MGLLDVCAIRWAQSRAYLRAEAPSIITAVPHQKCADFCDPNRSSSFPLASSTVRQTPLPPIPISQDHNVDGDTGEDVLKLFTYAREKGYEVSHRFLRTQH